MKKFLKFALKPQWKLISIILILIVVQTILQLTIFNLFDASLNYVETGNINGVIHNGKIMVIQTIMLVLLLIVSTILSNKVSSNAAYRTRQKLFHILTYLPLEEINNFKYTGLMSRTTRGVFFRTGIYISLIKRLIAHPNYNNRSNNRNLFYNSRICSMFHNICSSRHVIIHFQNE